jgi:4-hydroxybenzoyl-CoA thioesterase/acyl-CoA thioester hydrolase
MFSAARRIDFADTDMGGIVHFSRFFVFMETAEHQFLESLGTSVVAVDEGRQLGWPRVAVTCEYQTPLVFGDELEIRVRIERRGRSSVTYAFDFVRGDATVAHGRMTSVCCVLEPPQPPRSIPIPEALARRLDAAVGEASDG